MDDAEHVRQQFASALAGASRGREVADRLCGACVELLAVDGAALSIIYEGSISRSFGASSGLSRELDELQFTYGEGPCLEAVRDSTPVLVADLNEPPAGRWAGFADAATQRGVKAVFAFPVSISSLPIGALDLYRNDPGELDSAALAGSLIAAELAALPILDLMGIDLNAAVADETSGAWEELTALMRVEVYQAAGMLIAQLGVSASEAMVRLRGYAFSHDMTASEVAFQILDRKLRLMADGTTSAEDDGQA
jgi:hypothetical protein